MNTVAARQLADRQTLPLAIPTDLLELLHPRSHPLCDLPLEIRKARTVESPSDGDGAKSSVRSGAKSDGRNEETGELAHLYWFTYTEDAAGVPGKDRDGALAHITRSQTFTKERRARPKVRETFSAVADRGEIHLSLAYDQGGC
jgi:hypothetical protein